MLTPLTTTIPIRRITAYDFEWVPGTMHLRWCGAYDERGYRGYESISKWIEGELTHTNRGRWLYAHAGGLADAQFILWCISTELNEAGFTCEASFSGSSAVIIKVHKHRHTWTLIDSYWTFRSGLADIGRMVGMPKGSDTYLDPTEDGISEGERERRYAAMRDWYASVSLPELQTYNERDCKILFTALTMFQTWIIDEGGQMNATFASTAMATFRRRYLKRPVRTSWKVNHLAREAYVGGRVEVYERKCNAAYGYDINSSFPYAMARADSPGDVIGSGRMLPRHSLYLAHVDVEIPEAPIPPLFHRLDGRLYFPTGQWSGRFMGEDLQALVEQGGRILKVHDVLTFAPFDSLRDFALTLFERRKHADSEAEKMFIKYLLNSLYGKFGESVDKQGLVIHPSKIDLNRMEYMMPGVWLVDRVIDVPHEHVPIAAHITASARRELGRLMNLSSRVFYCDTDGFITTDRYQTSKDLGGLKLEKTLRRGHFVAPKVYDLETEDGNHVVRAKGFHRPTYEMFVRIAAGETIEREMMGRIRGNARLRGSLEPNERTMPKRLRFDKGNDKRYYYPDGTSRALTIEELRVKRKKT